MSEGTTMAGQRSEYPEGLSLRRFLSFRRGRLTPDEAATITAQVAAALATAHVQGTLHLGLRPENVVVVRGSSPPEARVAGFGTPRVPDPAYTAPEIRGGSAPSAAADVWSLGVMLVEMVTGDVQGDPRSLPSPLDVVSRDCLAVEPGRRPPAQRVAVYLGQVAGSLNAAGFPGPAGFPDAAGFPGAAGFPEAAGFPAPAPGPVVSGPPAAGSVPPGPAPAGTVPPGPAGLSAAASAFSAAASSLPAVPPGIFPDSHSPAGPVSPPEAPSTFPTVEPPTTFPTVEPHATFPTVEPHATFPTVEPHTTFPAAETNPFPVERPTTFPAAEPHATFPAAEASPFSTERPSTFPATEAGAPLAAGPHTLPADGPWAFPADGPGGFATGVAAAPAGPYPGPDLRAASAAPPPEPERRRWRRGPLLTLGAAVLVTAALAGLNLTASPGERPVQTAQQITTTAPAGTTTALSAPPTTALGAPPATTTAAQEQLRVTLAGKVDNDGGTLALSIRDGKAIAYVCDGDRVESWLQGTARDGALALKGRDGSSLTGTFDARSAEGEITVANATNTFKLGVVKKPSGLYRTAARVRGAQLDGGWIVLADGRQVGVLAVNGVPAPAPPLDLTTRTTTVDGETVPATTIDADSGEGF
ncbi:protein kinase [Actinoplanes sp. NPDC051861]|uniref:protein kinase domain-containing protein n=1 Tax=Actinoplanes sp. NPDC051861 TaxID=3155170 RepID=UPI003430EB07